MLSLQVLALALIPLLSGVVPKDGAMTTPLALLGIEEAVSVDFMVGAWKYSDEFFRWGVTDKEKAKVKPFTGHALMSLSKDGTMKMVNFFKPTEGRWELSADGIVIYDPRYPDRGSQLLPVRKRDNDRIWVLLPFAGGATGIGMVRVSDEEFLAGGTKADQDSKKRRKSQDRQSTPSGKRSQTGPVSD